MKLKAIALLTVSALFITVFAAEQPQKTGVIHFEHEKISAAFEKGGGILTTNNFKVQAGRRTGPGEVEIHEFDTDIFYIMEGSATFITGGKASETRSSGRGESRAKEIIGGEEHRLTKGDVIVIPNGVPHWFKNVDGLFLYYMVKVSK